MRTAQFCSVKTPSFDKLIEALTKRKSVELSVSDLQETNVLRSNISEVEETESGNENLFSFSGSCYRTHRRCKFEAICHKNSCEGYIEIIPLPA